MEEKYMKNTMNAQVFCKKNETNTLDFYLRVHKGEMYLFTTKYYSSVIHQTYCNERRIEEAYNGTSMIRQQKLRERILRMAKYTASEYALDLFDVSRRRKRLDDDFEIA
jgi:hypothetical protein